MPTVATRVSALRSPVVLFLATGLLALSAIVAGTTALSRRAAADEAVTDARQTTQILAHSVAEPALPAGLVAGEAGAVDRFDRSVRERLLVDGVRRVKIWRPDGRIVWSDETRLIGDRYTLDEDELAVLDQGSTEAEVSDLTKPENSFERDAGGLLEVYTRIVTPEGTPLLFEVYYSAAAVSTRQAEIVAGFRPITLGGLGLVVAVATALLWVLTRRLRRSSEERERFLVAAVEASEAERLRIARDLHDGVVQDLAGATFAISAMARRPGLEQATREGLEREAAVLRDGQRSLRSLMMEIYPPDLDATSLPAALHDLLAPAASQDIHAALDVGAVEHVGADAVRLVWRVAQEAVRNALRHSGAGNVTVTVRALGRAGRGVLLEVSDDGVGFDPASRPPSRFGLRGLSSLVADIGGRLDVRSGPGAGTTVTLRLEEEGT